VNPHIKALWVNALRSGEYEQGQGELISARHFLSTNVAYGFDARRLVGNGTKGRYCCLGVLCDLYERETGETLREGWDMTVLPAAVVDWAGLTDSNPDVNYDGAVKRFNKIPTLVDVNDYTSVGFVGIAAIIDDQL
jgi:hypothetical protein